MTRWRGVNVQALRMRAAVHHFKRMLVAYHQPGLAQPSDVFNALERLGYSEVPADRPPVVPAGCLPIRRARLWTRRTWQSWFAKDVEVPKRQKLEVMDEVAANGIRWIRPRDNMSLKLADGFYSEFVDGGLLKAMLSRTKSRRPMQALRERAGVYVPLSAWHLHFDALEARHHREHFYGVHWSRVVQIAAERILELLHHQWSPRRGAIYTQLSSFRQARWEASSNSYRERMLRNRPWRESPAREAHLLEALSDRPNWARIGGLADVAPVRSHLLLFAIGADKRFLSAPDHLAAWAFDLATSGLASSTLGRSQLAAFDQRLAFQEQRVIDSIDSLMFEVLPLATGLPDNDAPREPFEFDLALAVNALRGQWSATDLTAFFSARAAYESELSSLGIAVPDLGLASAHAHDRGPHRPKRVASTAPS